MQSRNVTLTAVQRRQLEQLIVSPASRSRMATRAKIVLLAADGISNTSIAKSTGTSLPTVAKWRGRYARSGLNGLVDQSRSGRPRVVDRDMIIAETLRPPPPAAGVQVWSSRALGAHLGVGDATVARVWREYGISTLSRGVFGFATDPEIRASAVDVRGIYLSSAARAVILRVGPSPVGEPMAGPMAYGHGVVRFARDAVDVHGDAVRVVVDGGRAPGAWADAGCRVHVASSTDLWLNLLSVWCRSWWLGAPADDLSHLPHHVRGLLGAEREWSDALIWCRGDHLPSS